MMVPHDLALAIQNALGFNGEIPNPPSTKLIGWATGVIGEITADGTVSNAAGTVTGDCSDGSPLSNGAATMGMISGLSASNMTNMVAADAPYPYIGPPSYLPMFCQAVTAHIMSAGTVVFASNSITGTCTDTPTSPGPLVDGAGMNGMIIGLSGSTLAQNIVSAVPFYKGVVSQKLIDFCTAITNYIMANAQVTYAAGQVTGTCPTGGGSLESGAATGGTIK